MTAKRKPLAWLVPRPDEPGQAILRRTALLLFAALTMANLIGATVVFAFSTWALPLPDVEDADTTQIVNLAVLGGAMILYLVVGSAWGARRLRPVRDWLAADREPTPAERYMVLRAPLQIAIVHAIMWTSAAVLFGGLNFIVFDSELGQRVAITVLLGGLTTTAIAYLFTERILRPAAARALASGVPERPVRPGVRARTLLAWSLGTGVPVLGVLLVALSTLIEHDFTATELAVTALALAGIALVAGLYVSMLAARAIADPVASLRTAVERVRKGDLETQVDVYDGSEVGQLQAGFNEMVAGLRERERIRDMFGRHVGEDVARTALEEDVELGGETRTVAILFCDVVGSTTIAANRDPHEVVEILNSFFAVVVEVVNKHGGWVNKFEGDAALAVFGAPVEVDDPARRALGAARELAERLRRLDQLEAAIGVSYGKVVAGNIGEESRFEYTVIGDPVNEAARLTELAKTKPGMVLASAAAVEAASPAETESWRLGESVELRGRSRSTTLATPA